MTSTSSRTWRKIARWTAAGATVALVALAIVLVTMAQGEVVSSAEHTQSAQTKELNEARRTLEAASQDVVIVRMLDGASFDGDRSERLASASTRVGEAAATIRALAAGNGLVAAEADALLDDLDADVLDDPLNGDIDGVFGFAEDTARWAGNDDVVTTRQAAIQQLSYVVSLPLHVMIEGIAADISVNERTVDSSIADFIVKIIGVARTEGGWYGPEATTPLSESEWIEIEEASELFPTATQRLNQTTGASSLIPFDAWMRELGNSNTPPPISVTDALAEADRLTAELSTVIDELIATEDILEDEALMARESKRKMLLGAAAVAALLAIAVGVVTARNISRAGRSARDRAELAMRDALTGAGNRHELDDRTRALTLSPRFGHHVVAMIDLDRFKMVNDVYGHAAGDAILVEIATRLKQAAAQIVTDRPDAETSVIRMGGDEFLLTAHDVRAFDIDAIGAELDRVRRDYINYNGDRIGLAFSVGICHLAGQHELADLMSAADLAAYEDKAARVRERKATACQLPPPNSDHDASIDQSTR